MKTHPRNLLTSRNERTSINRLIDKRKKGASSILEQPIPRLYRYGKISDRAFTKVLEHFVRDESASETAKQTGLSINSVNLIFQRVREFLYLVGATRDTAENLHPHWVRAYYRAASAHERRVLDFHRSRSAGKRRLIDPPDGPMLHFAETCWRYPFHLLLLEGQRISRTYELMLRHILELIYMCGPIDAATTTYRRVNDERFFFHIHAIAELLRRYNPNYRDDILDALLAIRLGLVAPPGPPPATGPTRDPPD